MGIAIHIPLILILLVKNTEIGICTSHSDIIVESIGINEFPIQIKTPFVITILIKYRT